MSEVNQAVAALGEEMGQYSGHAMSAHSEEGEAAASVGAMVEELAVVKGAIKAAAEAMARMRGHLYTAEERHKSVVRMGSMVAGGVDETMTAANRILGGAGNPVAESGLAHGNAAKGELERAETRTLTVKDSLSEVRERVTTVAGDIDAAVTGSGGLKDLLERLIEYVEASQTSFEEGAAQAGSASTDFAEYAQGV
jgi:hypothetical protein